MTSSLSRPLIIALSFRVASQLDAARAYRPVKRMQGWRGLGGKVVQGGGIRRVLSRWGSWVLGVELLRAMRIAVAF